MPWDDLDEHLAEAFSAPPSRRLDAEATARRAFLARRSRAQERYRWSGRHVLACRRWRWKVTAKRTCAGVWRELRSRASEIARKGWETRRAMARLRQGEHA